VTTRTFVRGTLLACLLALTTGTAVALALDKTITITVDDEQRRIHTFASSVAGALESAGLRVGDQDTLAPTASTNVEDGSRIVLQRARPLTLTVDGTQHKVWTTALTVENALEQMGMTARGMELSADPSRRIPLEGMALVVSIARPIDLPDSDLPAIAIHVIEQPSVKPLVRSQVKKVKDRIRVDVKAFAAAGTTVWDALARCESGGNWAADSGNGYYGGLQFDKGTWSANGGNEFAPYPHQASREQQILVAQRVHGARGGYRAWPACSSQLGLP
jgi:hypothetical protein